MATLLIDYTVPVYFISFFIPQTVTLKHRVAANAKR